MYFLKKFGVIVYLLLLIFATTVQAQNMKTSVFDWQGHRGCRGLLPENSIPAFLHALTFPQVTTLELDLAVSKDNQLIISHEPWISEAICSLPDGSPIQKKEAGTLKIRSLTYAEIKTYDCGSRGNERFPNQQKMNAYKPSLEDMIAAVRQFCQEKNRPLPRFNIEIKSEPNYDGILTPPINSFAEMVVGELKRLSILELSCIQSFDRRAIQAVKKLAPGATLALLVENLEGVDSNLKKLGFQPDVYSPYYLLLRKKTVKKLHEQGILVIPWTVNSVKVMKKMRRWGVDGIITDYPDLIAEAAH